MQKMSKQICQPQGMTLIELMIVIAILAIMAGMTMSALGKYIPDYRLQSAARELYANMHKAKSEAIKRNTDVKVIFDISNSKYAISLDHGDDGDWQTIHDNQNLKVVGFESYEGMVSYGIGDANYKGVSEIVSYDPDRCSFSSTGTSSSGYVYLTNTKGNSFAIGTLSSGVILLSKWISGKWSE